MTDRRTFLGMAFASLIALPQSKQGRTLDNISPDIVSDAVKFGELNIRRKRGERDMNAVYDGMRALATNIKRDAELALTLLRGL